MKRTLRSKLKNIFLNRYVAKNATKNSETKRTLALKVVVVVFLRNSHFNKNNFF